MTKLLRVTSGLALLIAAAGSVSAQTVERRVSGAPDGNVTFNFASRADVCGDGRNYIRADDMWMGSFNDGIRAQACERGPIRVLLTRDGRDIIRITTFAGPVAEEPGATNLGAVPAADAAAWLLGIASRVDGRPGRDAIMPAALADSALVTRELLAIARTSTARVSFVGRCRGSSGGVVNAAVVRRSKPYAGAIARDETKSHGSRPGAEFTVPARVGVEPRCPGRDDDRHDRGLARPARDRDDGQLRRSQGARSPAERGRAIGPDRRGACGRH
jgi:hypothetical protein